jgi:hypothetical protein
MIRVVLPLHGTMMRQHVVTHHTTKSGASDMPQTHMQFLMTPVYLTRCAPGQYCTSGCEPSAQCLVSQVQRLALCAPHLLPSQCGWQG